MIGCLRIPYFAAEVVRREYGLAAETPLGVARRGKISATCSHAVGVQIGLKVIQAQAILPQLVVVEDDEPCRVRARERLLERLTEFTPLVECQDESAGTGRKKQKRLPDEYQALVLYVNFEALIPADIERIARQMCIVVEAITGVTPGVGLASGKFPAYAASYYSTSGEVCFVPSGGEADFLAALPIHLLPLDAETYRRLALLGLRSLGQLADLPQEALLTQFGAQGFLLYRLAQGHDYRPVIPHRGGLVEQVVRACDEALTSQTILEALLRSMAFELSARLQANGQMGCTLVLTLRFEDRTSKERRLTLREPVSDVAHLTDKLLQLLARALPVQRGVLGIEVALQGLIPLAGRQLDLFIYQTQQRTRLNAALGTLTARYGAKTFLRITPAELSARRIERRYQIRPIDEQP